MSADVAMAVWGPTQMGKTSFLKTLGAVSAETGTGNGRSVTSHPEQYDVEMVWPREGQRQKISLIDMPGLDDTELRFNNSFVCNVIGLFLSDKNIPKLDALLVMQSVAESKNRLLITLEQVTKAFGPDAKRSVIVILTKIDIGPRRAPKMKESIIKQCEDAELPYVEWNNLCSGDDLEVQKSNLHAAFLRVRPYLLQSSADFKRATEALAFELRENDPDRFFVQKVEIPVQRVEVRNEHYKLETVEYVPKYKTGQEIEVAAKELQRQSPKNFQLVTGKFILRPQEYFEEIVTKRELFGITLYQAVGTKKSVQMIPTWEEETKMVEQPLQHFISLVQKEMVPRPKSENRTEQKFEQKKEIETTEIMVDKYPIEHYVSKAKKQMIKEIWELPSVR